MSQLTTGLVVDDRYEIIELIGSGAFGSVYKAWQMQFERAVALKILNKEVLRESDGRARFEREAKALSGLHHRNIVGFYGYGVWEGAPYMVMECLQGLSLQNKIRTEGRLKPLVAAEIMKQVCEALGSAHAHDIVHRDLKPSNIMLEKTPDDRPLVKIIDFGLAKLMPGYGATGQKLTDAGCALGTAHYMSPEQCRGGEIDHRSDIYAAGCILYHCIAGQFPYDADTPLQIMYHHINDVPRPLSLIVGGGAAVDAIQAVIDRALAKNAEERYQSANQMAQDIDAILCGRARELAGAGRTSRRLFLPLSFLRTLQKNLFLIIPIAIAIIVGGLMAWKLSERPKESASSAPPSTVLVANYADIRPRIVAIPISDPTGNDEAKRSDWTGAIAVLNEAVDRLRASPNSTDAAHQKAIALLQLKVARFAFLAENYPYAEKALVRVHVDRIENPDLFWDTREAAAEIALARGKFAVANDIYNQILASAPSSHRPRTLIGLTRRALVQEHYSESTQPLHDLLPLLTPELQHHYDIIALKLAAAALQNDKPTIKSILHQLESTPLPPHTPEYAIQGITEVATCQSLTKNNLSAELLQYRQIMAKGLQSARNDNNKTF